MLYRVQELSPEQKRAAEVLLGHTLSDNEAVSIRSFDASTILPAKLSPEERVAAMRALDQRFAGRQVPEVSAEGEEELVSDAFRSVRRTTSHSLEGHT